MIEDKIINYAFLHCMISCTQNWIWLWMRRIYRSWKKWNTW